MKKSTTFLLSTLIIFFMTFMGNGNAWGSTNYFTPGKTIYFHVSGDCKNWGSNQFAALFYYQNNENKAYGYENESYSARQFIGNNSIGSSNRIKCTKINDDYYSVVVPSNGTANIGYVRLIHLNTDDGWSHQANKKASADSFTGTNNCVAYSGWDDADPTGYEAYNSGECITSACGGGGGGDPEPEPQYDYTFTQGRTMYFDLRNAAWYDGGACLYAEFFTENTSRGESSLLSETGTSHVYSFQIPNRNDITKIVINRYSPDDGGHAYKWGYTADMTAEDAGINNCIYMPSWTSDPVSCNWTTFVAPSPYSLRGDFWLNGSGDWLGGADGPRFTDNGDGTHTISYLVNTQAPRITLCNNSSDESIDYWDGTNSTSGFKNEGGSKYKFNRVSGIKRVTLTYTTATNKLKGIVSAPETVTTGWQLYVDGGSAVNMDNSGQTMIYLASGDHTFYITDGSATTLWGVNKFGGMYLSTSATGDVSVTFPSVRYYDSGTTYKFNIDGSAIPNYPINGTKDPTAKFTLASAANVTFSFDGGTITLNAVAPAAPHTVTIHPNNGSANFTMDVPDGNTISSISASYGQGTASWYTDEELTIPFTLNSSTVSADMDLYAKWGVSGNYYIVGCLQTADDAGETGNWSNSLSRQMTYSGSQPGVCSFSFVAPAGKYPFEIIKNQSWSEKINSGSYGSMFDNSKSNVTLSESNGHLLFELAEPKQVTVSYDGKVWVNVTDYSFDNSKTWNIKTSWGNGGAAWNYDTHMINNGTTNATAMLHDVSGTNSFIISTKTNDGDAQAVIGNETFNALYVDMSSPSSGLTWNTSSAKRDGSDNFNSTTPQSDGNYWRNCKFTLSQPSDILITFDGGKIRCDIVYTVTFNSNGGSAVSSQTIPSGSTATEPSAPTKDGYTFVKWQKEGADYNFSTPVTGNITLDAVWVERNLQYLYDNTHVNGTLVLDADYVGQNLAIDKPITIDGAGYTIGNLTVENTGDLTLTGGNLTVNDFTICAKAGNTTTPAESGQVRSADKLTVNGNAYFLYTVDPSGNLQKGWYDFTVPFPVDVMTGIRGIKNSSLKPTFQNEVDYAVMEFLGDKQAQGQYPYKKFRGVMQPNKLYSITLDYVDNCNTVRFQKASGVLVASNNVTLNEYIGDGTHDNWNGVGNGTLHHADVAGISATHVQVYQSGDKTFMTIGKSDKSLAVGTAFLVQATGTMTLNQAEGSRPLMAPSRQATVQATAIQIAREGQPFSDQLFITADELGGSAYTQGVDLAKAGEFGKANVPQIGTNAYNTLLCVHNAQLINKQAQYALSLYAPANGTYTLTTQHIPEDMTLYLTQNGKAIWNLSMAETCSLELTKGISNEYGLLLVESYKVPTAVEEVQGDKIQSTKVLRNGILYILRNGEVFNAQGARVQ